MKPGMKKCYEKFIALGKHKKVALTVGVRIIASDKQTTFALQGLVSSQSFLGLYFSKRNQQVTNALFMKAIVYKNVKAFIWEICF